MVTASGILSCLNSGTGKIVWKERIGGDFASSPLAADGRIYLFSAIGGKTTVIAPGDQLQVLATNVLDDGCMASPAIVGNFMIVRTKKNLYRIEN
jgi:outer membrane protein assembly factor BamB